MTSTRFYDAKSNNVSDVKLRIVANPLPKVSYLNKLFHIKFYSNITFYFLIKCNLVEYSDNT